MSTVFDRPKFIQKGMTGFNYAKCMDYLAWFKTFLASFKLTLQTMFCVFVLGILALVWPARWFASAPIHAAVNAHIVWVVALTGFSGVWILSSGAGAAWKWGISQRAEFVKRKAIKDHLHNLPEDHLRILLLYVTSGKTSINFRPEDGVVSELRARGILFCPTGYGTLVGGLAYNITPCASKYMKNKEFRVKSEEFQAQMLVKTGIKSGR